MNDRVTVSIPLAEVRGNGNVSPGDYLNVVGLPVPAVRALVQGLVPPF